MDIKRELEILINKHKGKQVGFGEIRLDFFAEDCLKEIRRLKTVIARQSVKSDIGETSDGYHTFNELYEHRTALFATLCNMRSDISWKSMKHDDGTMYEGMFIAGIETPDGQYTYHCEMEYWYMFAYTQEIEKAPAYDGHQPSDYPRLLGLSENSLYHQYKQSATSGDAFPSAIKWTGKNLREVIDLTGWNESASSKWTWAEYEQVVEEKGLKIFTPSGSVMADIGDWIIYNGKDCYVTTQKNKSATSEDVAKEIEWATEELNDSIRYQHNHKAGCLDTIITALQAYQPWIPVSERLPMEEPDGRHSASKMVLVYAYNGYSDRFASTDITVDGKWYNYSEPEFEVTHWMPLPQVPKENDA